MQQLFACKFEISPKLIRNPQINLDSTLMVMCGPAESRKGLNRLIHGGLPKAKQGNALL